MFNSVTHGRQQARRVLVAQSVAVAVSALVLLAAGPAHALAAVLGGGALALGGWVAAWLAFGGAVPAAAAAMARLLAGTVVKWLVLVGVLVAGVALWRLPPLGLMIGVVVALATQIVVMLRR